MSEPYHFQVNLGGMLDVLSNHLYKRPDVFLRELLQNGIDAITLRTSKQANWKDGAITIDVEENRVISFSDNGAGLTEDEIHQFLAVIGQSSKTELKNGELPTDYIGHFGIGLLSCFMVSEDIVVMTRSVDDSSAYRWCGYADGTYTLETVDDALPIGTTVSLRAKSGAESYFTRTRVEELVRYYGLALPVPICFAGKSQRMNGIPSQFDKITRMQQLDFGKQMFDESFLDAIPIQTTHLSGVAYILPYETASTLKHNHRIYLKQMLLTERGDRLLPPWAFFLRCFINTQDLRPTASREDFYEDEALELAQQEFAGVISEYLTRLVQDEPERLQKIVRVHFRALKSMAVWDDALFHLFIDYLPFTSSVGAVTGAELKRVASVTVINSIDRFRQLSPVFSAQQRLLVCTGYTSDAELMDKLYRLCGVPVEFLCDDKLGDALQEPTLMQRDLCANLLRAANRALAEYDCCVEAKCFSPADLPVLFCQSEEVDFIQTAKDAQALNSGVFSDALSFMLSDVEEMPLSTLYINLSCTLIVQLCFVHETMLLESVARILYVQARLTGGYSLRGREHRLIGQELLHLIGFLCKEEDSHGTKLQS